MNVLPQKTLRIFFHLKTKVPILSADIDLVFSKLKVLLHVSGILRDRPNGPGIFSLIRLQTELMLQK
jgi:hypothetical protein